MDESTIDGTLYSKHTVEVVRLKTSNSRVVITRNVNKPRGLWIDFVAKLTSANKIINIDNINIVMDQYFKLFWDLFFQTWCLKPFNLRHIYYTDWGQPAKVVRSNLDGTNAITILSNEAVQFQNPNSVVASSNKIFVTLMSSEKINTNESVTNGSSVQGYLWYIDKDKLNGSLTSYNWSKSVLQGSEVYIEINWLLLYSLVLN